MAKTKPMTVVIADAGPIIALSRIDKLDLLQQVFQQITITKIIHDEILKNDHCKGKMAVIKAIDDGWLKVQSVDMSDWKTINPSVDAGEASAIYFLIRKNRQPKYIPLKISSTNCRLKSLKGVLDYESREILLSSIR